MTENKVEHFNEQLNASRAETGRRRGKREEEGGRGGVILLCLFTRHRPALSLHLHTLPDGK